MLVCCWFSSLLRGFFSGYSSFPPSIKPTFPNSHSTWKQWTNSHSVDVPLKFPFIYLFIYFCHSNKSPKDLRITAKGYKRGLINVDYEMTGGQTYFTNCLLPKINTWVLLCDLQLYFLGLHIITKWSAQTHSFQYSLYTLKLQFSIYRFSSL